MDTQLWVSTPGVLQNDEWANRAELISGPWGGYLSLSQYGWFTYTPPPGSTGTDTFQYAAKHSVMGGWSTAFVTINVYSPQTLNQPAKNSKEPSLQMRQLEAIREAAIGLWLAAGVDKEVLATRVAGVKFTITDLPGSHLGGATGKGRIAIDTNAAGHGWFIEATPWDHSEFQRRAGALDARAAMASEAGRVDLLTTVMHEMGHELGLYDLVGSRGSNVMAVTIDLGTRRLPSARDAMVVDYLFSLGYAGRRR